MRSLCRPLWLSVHDRCWVQALLQVFSLEFGRGKGLVRAGQPVSASDSFYRLVWGTFNAKGAFPDGILAGALADGSIALWDPSKIVQGQGNASLIAQLQAHKGPVKALEFNRLSPNLLASGGVDGELKIWAITDPKAPTPYPAVAEAGAPGGSLGITHLTWNPKVAHILATGTETGVVKVWDMKKRSLVMELADKQGRMKRFSVVAWHPVFATQLVVGCADDLSPLLQIWDLRKYTMPIRELLGHEKGVVTASWCTQDPGMLLSSGKDGRTILWDVSPQQDLPLGQPIGEFSAGLGEYVHDLAWSPSNPGVFAAASLGGGENHSGAVWIQTLAAFTEPRLHPQYSEDGFSGSSTAASAAPPLARAPVWLKRPAAATFGFGGRLVWVTNTKRQDGSVMATLSLKQDCCIGYLEQGYDQHSPGAVLQGSLYC
ncbi:Protein transport protein sec31 [Coccomyxa sp. Obi]|nr:Protein transport protein sec31 [Coccomyxa sp. Obi]